MTDQIPEPLVPAEVDLRDYDFMPLKVATLRDAKIVDAVTGNEFRAAVLLWCASWHQVPAASLPDDDVQLAKFAGYGRVIKEWNKVRKGALYGFVKCSDGRLYHPKVAEVAATAWAGKRKASSAGKAGAKAKWAKANGGGNAAATENDATAIQTDGNRINSATKIDGNREGEGEGEGEGQGIESSLRSRKGARASEPQADEGQPETPDFLRRYPDNAFTELAKAYPHPPNSSIEKAWDAWKRKAEKPAIDVLLQCVSDFTAHIASENAKRSKDDPFRVCSLATWIDDERWTSFLARAVAKKRSGNAGNGDAWRSIWGGHQVVEHLVGLHGSGLINAWLSGSTLDVSGSAPVVRCERGRMQRDEIMTRFGDPLEKFLGENLRIVVPEEEPAAA